MKYAATVLASLVAGVAFSQSPRSLTLDDCVALALRTNARVEASGARSRLIELAGSELSVTGLPRLRINAGGIYAPVTSRLGYDPVISNEGQVNGQLLLEESLFDGGVRSLKESQNDIDFQRALHEQRAVERDLTLEVTTHFIEILRAEREKALREESITQLSGYLDLLRQLVGGGTAGQTDVLKTEVQLSSDRLALEEARETLTVAKYQLAEAIGGSIDTSFELSGALDSLLISPAHSTSPPDTLSGNLDLHIAEMEFQSSQIEASVAAHERYPVISLFADAGVLTSVENLRLPADQRSSIWGYSVGLSVDGALFNWGATDRRIEQREVQSEILRLQNLSLKRSLQSEYGRTRLQLSLAQTRLGQIRSNLRTVEENYLLTKALFAGGKALSLEVLNAQQLLTETRLAELQTLTDIQMDAAKIRQLSQQ